MIQLRVRTEFHFDPSNKVYGKLPDVVARLKELVVTAAGIADCTTYGHVGWHRELSVAKIKPLLGAELRCSGGERVGLLAMNGKGLRTLYRVMGEEVNIDQISDIGPEVAKFIITPYEGAREWSNAWATLDPSPPTVIAARLATGAEPILSGDNYYPSAGDRALFELFGGSLRMDPRFPQHIADPEELRQLFPATVYKRALKNTKHLADSATVALPISLGVFAEGSLEKLARAGKKRVKNWSAEYDARLKRELALLKEKGFESYMLLLADAILWAKKRMLVGPARGSAAGSLVAFLTGITDVDPLAHGLLFERFVDITRKDLPDIDVDFPDSRREEVIEYLRGKYGEENVARLGTIQTFQPRSILAEAGKRLQIPIWELSRLKEVMIERSSGDSRAALCLLDTLETMEAGQEVLKKYPALRRVTALEGHAKYSGTHAAGVLVCPEPVRHFATVQSDGTAQIDKRDAEFIGLLKLDLLGLRTLSIIEEAIAGKEIDLTRLPLDDPLVYSLLNQQRYAGIFQFEGDAVQMLSRRMVMDRFSDIVALGALARPGPLNSGGAMSFVNRRNGTEPIEYLHPLVEPYTRETLGIIAYQEQVMEIGREIGDLSWDDVTALRKAMSKSLGEEFFNQYWTKFRDGSAKKHGLKERQARHIWDNMNTMGSWAFNKSHAVSYGLLSYWCAWLKAHHLLDFAAATLRHAKSEEQTVLLLRELSREGVRYVAFDPDLSDVNWSVVRDTLVGGFLNLKGFGEVKAARFVEQRAQKGWDDKMREAVRSAPVLYTDVNPTETLWGHIYRDPAGAGLRGIREVLRIEELEGRDSFAFIGQLKIKNPRDLNEYVFQVKRTQEGKPAVLTGKPTQYLNLMLEDDTGKAYCTVSVTDYEEVGRDIVQNGVPDVTWYLVQGRRNRIGRINITWAKQLSS